jgi:TRAP-type uncharacterized transport system substrate-binding protein
MRALIRSLPFVLLGLVLVAGLVAAVAFVLRPLNLYPPPEISIAAGAPGSAYYDSARAYQRILARDGITLTILSSNGSAENASSLAVASGADIALVQGGVPLPEGTRGIASVRVEPLWIFTALPLDDDPHGWAGLRIAAGKEGSGTRLVADGLARITGADSLLPGQSLSLGSADAASGILDGSVDVALFVAPADAAYLQPLLESERLHLSPLAHSESIALRLAGARRVRLPSGILDYERPLPVKDMELVALVTRLVAREGLHPALVNRLVHAVLEVHSGGVIPADRQYPASSDLGIEPDAYAVQLLDKGFSALEQFLPYWIVAQLNRVLLVLLPALLLLLPLMRLLPALYGAILDRRVYRHYARVHEIDATLMQEGHGLDNDGLRELRGELDGIERKILRANLPNSYRKQAYTLLHHLDYVRKRAEDMLDATPAHS